MPRLGVPRRELHRDLRSIPLGSYVIFYVVSGEGRVRIERIIHGARDLHQIFEGDQKH